MVATGLTAIRTLPADYAPGNLLTPQRAAFYLGVAESTLETWRRERGLPALKLSGKVIVYRRNDLDAWAAAQAANKG